RRQAVLATFVGDGRQLLHLQGRARDRHGHSGKHAAALVFHLADDTRGLSLAGSREVSQREQPEERDQRQNATAAAQGAGSTSHESLLASSRSETLSFTRRWNTV